MRSPTALTFLFLLPLTVSAATQSAEELRFELLADGSIVVPVSVNGAGPFRFMVDTGSTRSAVTEALAFQLRLPAVGASTMATPTGRVARILRQVERLDLAGRLVDDICALVLPSGGFGPRIRVDGLLGQDVLASSVYTIDYERKVIEWDTEVSTDSPHTRLPLSITTNHVLVSLPQRPLRQQTLQFIPDSGADGIVIFARGGGTTLNVTPLEQGLLRSVSGQKVVRRVLVDDLRVGDVLLRNQTAALLPSDHADPALGDGLLPLHLFARVTFNAAEQYLVVEGRR